jgi:hypothetical protein
MCNRQSWYARSRGRAATWSLFAARGSHRCSWAGNSWRTRTGVMTEARMASSGGKASTTRSDDAPLLAQPALRAGGAGASRALNYDRIRRQSRPRGVARGCHPTLERFFHKPDRWGSRIVKRLVIITRGADAPRRRGYRSLHRPTRKLTAWRGASLNFPVTDSTNPSLEYQDSFLQTRAAGRNPPPRRCGRSER